RQTGTCTSSRHYPVIPHTRRRAPARWTRCRPSLTRPEANDQRAGACRPSSSECWLGSAGVALQISQARPVLLGGELASRESFRKDRAGSVERIGSPGAPPPPHTPPCA